MSNLSLHKHCISLFFPILTVILFSSCGTLLDDAKFRGIWYLTEANFYQYNSEFNSYLSIVGLDDLSPDINSPIIGNFFGVKMTDIHMTIATNKTWTADGKSESGSRTEIVSESDSGKWDIDTYNNTVTLTCPSGKDTTADQLWTNSNKITNAWPMTNNNKFYFYVKASDLGLPYFEFEIAEKPVPDKIEKSRLDDYLSDKSGIKFTDDNASFVEFCYKWYKLDDTGKYYYLQNSISPDNKNRLYRIFTITEKSEYDDKIKFVSNMTTKQFYAMKGTFKRQGYTD